MICECCKARKALDKPVRFPNVPMVYHLCQNCQAAGVIPYDLLLTWVWLGEVDITNAWARDVALYHGHGATQFEVDCINFSDKMDEAFNE